ncbi:MAG: hypothetical protein R2854_06810 [Caldilineaceae bacterium]
MTLHGTFVGLLPFAQTIKLLESQRVQPSILIRPSSAPATSRTGWS